jgi:uncharacterized protein YidB (DUF937 family)
LIGQLGLGGASGGLGELLERFQQSGQADTAESWVNTGANKPCTAAQLERAIGPEVLDTLSTQTGLGSRLILPKPPEHFTDLVPILIPRDGQQSQ